MLAFYSDAAKIYRRAIGTAVNGIAIQRIKQKIFLVQIKVLLKIPVRLNSSAPPAPIEYKSK